MSVKLARFLESVAAALRKIAINLYPAPEITGEATSAQVRSFLKNELRIGTCIILDDHYKVLTKDSISTFFEFNQVDNYVYIIHQLDCDNFAFKSFVDFKDWCPLGALGIVIGVNTRGVYHAWNFFLMSDGEHLSIAFIEPQNDSIFDYTSERLDTVII
jgi:hypothetical protein